MLNHINHYLTKKEFMQLCLVSIVAYWTNSNTKNNLTTNFKVVTEKATDTSDNHALEDFHGFLRAPMDILTKNVHLAKDDSYHN